MARPGHNNENIPGNGAQRCGVNYLTKLFELLWTPKIAYLGLFDIQNGNFLKFLWIIQNFQPFYMNFGDGMMVSDD